MDKNDSAQNFCAVSYSGGKDSTYMLLRMIELGMPIDAVLCADTGMEFPEMYDHLQKVDDLLFPGARIPYDSPAPSERL